MSRADVQVEILEPMQIMFEPPKPLGANERHMVLNGYIAVLAGFDALTLRSAWLEVVSTQRSSKWPTPGIIVGFARKIAKDRDPGAGPTRTTGKTHPREATSYTDRYAAWKAVSKSDLARRAVAHGVAWSLKCAVLDDGVSPAQIDLRRLTEGKERAAALLLRINAGQPLVAKDGRDLGAMRPKDAELAQRLYAGIAANEQAVAHEIAANQVAA